MAENGSPKDVALKQTTAEKVVSYEAADGQRIDLTVDVVKKYLVNGKPELITVQELVYFLNICRARRLNPLTKDCYLVKYDNSPAAIITSIDFYRKQAKAQPDCKGWQKGVILWDDKANKEVRTNGIVPPGLKLIGAWFKAKPAGWEVDFDLEVNLNGYIKTTREGKPTQFWSEANQPSQIMKVAEAQGLRTIWPGLFQNIYEESEVSAPDDIVPMPAAIDVGASADRVGAEILEGQWKAAIPAGQDLRRLDEFLKITAEKNKITVDDLKRKLIETNKVADIVGRVYPAWVKMQQKQPPAPPADPPPAEVAKEQPKQQPSIFSEPCPNNPENSYEQAFCEGCPEYQGCPAWDKKQGGKA